jgi:hypothetical protein
MSDDRVAYGSELAESWKQQFLLNTVRIRYADPPVLLDVTSIIQQYSVKAESSLLTTADPGAWSTTFGEFLVGGTYEDRPTVTYTPLRGDQFTRTMLTPIPPSVLVFLMQGGWPVDSLLFLYSKSVNGRQSRAGTGKYRRSADPEFLRALQLLGEQQQSGRMTLRILREEGKNSKEVVVLVLPRGDAARTAEIRGLLGLAPDAAELRIVYGAAPRTPDEVAILTRSMLEVMREFASCVEVPEEDVASGSAEPALPPDENEPRFMRILRSESRPEEAFVRVRYRGAWWYIDDHDAKSKMAFTVSLLLLSLQETTGTTAAPVVTISAN